MPDTHRLTPGQPIVLSDCSTRGRDFRNDLAEAKQELREDFGDLHKRSQWDD